MIKVKTNRAYADQISKTYAKGYDHGFETGNAEGRAYVRELYRAMLEQQLEGEVKTVRDKTRHDLIGELMELLETLPS